MLMQRKPKQAYVTKRVTLSGTDREASSVRSGERWKTDAGETCPFELKANERDMVAVNKLNSATMSLATLLRLQWDEETRHQRLGTD